VELVSGREPNCVCVCVCVFVRVCESSGAVGSPRDLDPNSLPPPPAMPTDLPPPPDAYVLSFSLCV